MYVYSTRRQRILHNPLSLSLRDSLRVSWLKRSSDLFNEVPKCCCSCFLSAQIHSDTRDMLGFISGRPGLCGTTAGITTRFPAKIFTTQLHRIHRKRNYPLLMKAWWHDASSRWQQVCVTSEAKKKISKCTFVCFSGKGNVDRHASGLHYTGQLVKIRPCCWFGFFFFFLHCCSFMTPISCDKSQHQSGDSFITSFTLHFQPWAAFWLGL